MNSNVLRIVVGIEALLLGGLLLILTPRDVAAVRLGCCNTACLTNDWSDGCIGSIGRYCTQTEL